MTVDTQDWMAEAVRLRREEQMPTQDIAARVDRSPSRVRRVLAEANAARFTEPSAGDRVTTREEFDAAEETAHLHTHTEAGPIPGQTTVDDHLPSEEPPPEDDPEYEAEAYEPGPANEYDQSFESRGLEDFKAEAGEAVGPMPPAVTITREMDGGELVETAPPIRGTAQLALDFGPNAAMVTSATVVFKSEKLGSGYFEMGDVISGRFTARITGINGAEKLDRDLGEFVAKPQAHTATITEIEIG